MKRVKFEIWSFWRFLRLFIWLINQYPLIQTNPQTLETKPYGKPLGVVTAFQVAWSVWK